MPNPIPKRLDKAVQRKRWKLLAMKALSERAGVGLASIRRTVGTRNFSELVDEAFASSASDPIRAAEIIRVKLFEKYGALLEQPLIPWERG